MDRYEKIKKIESLEKVQKGLKKLWEENESELKSLNNSELPILMTHYVDENGYYLVYYLGDLDKVEIGNEVLANTIDLESKLNCQFNVVSITKTKEYLNNLINKVIKTNDVDNWVSLGILLEKEITKESSYARRRVNGKKSNRDITNY